MDRKDAEYIALLMYRQVITEAGYGHPETYEEMLQICLDRDVDVVHCPHMPRGFPGAAVGGTIYINARAGLPEQQMMRFLAHEFAHFLRRNASLWPRHIRFYKLAGRRLQRDEEEQIARAFERLF